jgi:heptosyltransferase-2
VDFLLNIKSDFQWDKLRLHQTERNLDIVRQINCDLTLEEKKNLRIGLTEEEKKFADDFIKINLPDKNKKIIAFQPGAGKVANRWSIENFIELISLLHKKYNPYILINSGPIDKEITDEVTKRLSKLGIQDIVLYNPIREVGAILAKSDLFITNDTGTMHVAAMVNTKVIALFGPTNAFEWAPRFENGTYIQSKSENINDITVKEVFEKVCDILDNNGTKR